MKKQNLIFFSGVLLLIFSGCSQKNLRVVTSNNNEHTLYSGVYDFTTKQLSITDGIDRFKSSTFLDFTKPALHPSTKMIIDSKENQNCGIIIRKNKLFSTKSLVQKDDVRTSGFIKLNDKNSLSITIDEEYMIGEAKDQNGKCYKVLLSN